MMVAIREVYMNKEERKAYWEQEIAFDCPIYEQKKDQSKRHSIDYCFKHCQMSATTYHDGAAFLICALDIDERELHNGKPTRFC